MRQLIGDGFRRACALAFDRIDRSALLGTDDAWRAVGCRESGVHERTSRCGSRRPLISRRSCPGWPSGSRRRQASATTLTFDASGRLAEQIKAGAPYDVFLSANGSFPRDLAERD